MDYEIKKRLSTTQKGESRHITVATLIEGDKEFIKIRLDTIGGGTYLGLTIDEAGFVLNSLNRILKANKNER